jgi:signal peptidase
VSVQHDVEVEKENDKGAEIRGQLHEQSETQLELSTSHLDVPEPNAHQFIQATYKQLLETYEQVKNDINEREQDLQIKLGKIPTELIELREFMLGQEQEIKAKLGIVNYRAQGSAIQESIQEKYHRLLEVCDQAKEEIEGLKNDLEDKVLEQLDEAEEFMFEVEEEAKRQLGIEYVKKEVKKRKLLTVFGNLAFYGMLIIVVLGVAFFSGGPQGEPRSLFGYTPMTVLTGSMQREIPQGAFIIAKEVDPSTIQIGHDITYIEENGRITTHRVVDIIENHGGSQHRAFQTQGLENAAPDEELVIDHNLIGKVIFMNHLMGQIIQFVQEFIVFIVLFIVLFACLFVVLKNYMRAGKGVRREKKPI